MNANILPTALLFCSVVFTVSAKTKIVALFHKVLCENQEPKTIVIFNCYVNLTTSNVSGLYVEFKLAEDVTNVNGLYLLAIEHGNKFINYTAQEMNYCEALHMVHKQYLTQMVAVGLRRVSNFPLDCPFKKELIYYVNGFTIDPKVIPVYMPRIHFKMTMTFVSDKHKLGSLTTLGQIERK